MCGILGQWNRDGRPVDIERFVRANSLQRHRGPDDEGYLLADSRTGSALICKGDDSPGGLDLPHVSEHFGGAFDIVLGHRRLSILDLSPAGHQPMGGGGDGVAITYNGEVYNYRAIREELEGAGYRFESGTDTEVILRAYQEWGADCVSRFNGMWALAIVDFRGGEPGLFFSRDRFGIKPLNYSEAGGRLVFGSEFKSVFPLLDRRPEIDPGYVALFMANGHYPADSGGETFYRGVGALPPGCSLTAGRDDLSVRRYWDLGQVGPDGGGATGEEVAEELHELLSDAVRLRLRADVRVGSCLSGGVDSSGIVALANRHLGGGDRAGEFDTFSAVYESEGAYNERSFIDIFRSRYRTRGHFVVPTSDRLNEELDRIVYHQELPFPTTSIFAQWCVMEEAKRRDTPVLLDGQAADELFGGYRPYPILLRERVASEGFAAALRTLREIKSVTGMGMRSFAVGELKRRVKLSLDRRLGFGGKAGGYRLLARGLAESVDLQRYRDVVRSRYESGFGKGGGLEKCLMDMVTDFHLGVLLHFEDRNSMAFSREARVPFTDYRVVEHAFRRAPGHKLKGGWTKWVLRKALSELLPEEICWRRDKVGFETPEHEFVTAAYRYRRDRLDDTGSRFGDFCDRAMVRKLGESVLRGERVKLRHYRMLWKCLCLQSWVDGDLFGASPLGGA